MSSYAKSWQQGFRYLSIRIALLVVVMVFYQLMNWQLLIKMLVYFLDSITKTLGYVSVLYIENDNYIQVIDGFTYHYNSNCTYIDLALIITPFCIRFNKGVLINLSRIIILTILILIMNVMRIITVIFLHSKDMSWQLAHNIPDMLIHTILIAICVYLALRIDFTGKWKESPHR